MTRGRNVDVEDYWSPRRCLRQPIPEIALAANLLAEAADHHVAGRRSQAAKLIVEADMPIIREWIESLWGSEKLFPAKRTYIRFRETVGLGAPRSSAERVPARGPTNAIARQVTTRFGWLCAYCGNRLIARAARHLLQREYSEARWGRSNNDRHNALMCLDNEFDHIVPHARGGTNDVENLVPCCAPCNCGKESYTLAQLGLLDPRNYRPSSRSWDGLTRLLPNMI